MTRRKRDFCPPVRPGGRSPNEHYPVHYSERDSHDRMQVCAMRPRDARGAARRDLGWGKRTDMSPAKPESRYTALRVDGVRKGPTGPEQAHEAFAQRALILSREIRLGPVVGSAEVWTIDDPVLPLAGGFHQDHWLQHGASPCVVTSNGALRPFQPSIVAHGAHVLALSGSGNRSQKKNRSEYICT